MVQTKVLVETKRQSRGHDPRSESFEIYAVSRGGGKTNRRSEAETRVHMNNTHSSVRRNSGAVSRPFCIIIRPQKTVR